MRHCALCGQLHDRKTPKRKASYCLTCHAAFMRATRPKYSELTAIERFKSNARAYANTYQRRGKLLTRPCEVCGSAQSEKHHDDYTKPLKVRWYCRNCHIQLHKNELFHVAPSA